MARLLTPIAKFWICKRGSHFAQEAMECLGGNGYVEAGGQGAMARIYREMPLNSIWEGAGNIQSLDLLRALKSGPVAEALMYELAPARAASALVARRADALHAALDGDVDEFGARRLARDVALLLQASLLQRISPAPLFEAFVESRLDGANDAFGQLPPTTAFDAILARATLES